jgi:c-di-GMP-binding flagellar brake protein YcgR
VDKTLPDDRRRYFRISDNIGLAYQVMADHQITGTGAVRGEPVRISELLAEHDLAIAHLLQELRPQDPRVAELGARLNEKINCIVKQMELASRRGDQEAQKIVEVNISACGLGFQTVEAIPVGARVQLDMVLLPDNKPLLLQAVVIACEPQAGGHYVRMDYVDLSAGDQELLIQHVVKRQGDLLREARELAERAARDGDS